MNEKETTLIWLLGLISTDGSVSKHKGKYGFSFNIASIEEKWLKVIQNRLKDIGIETSIYYYRKQPIQIALKNPSKIASLFDSVNIEKWCSPRKAKIIRKAISCYKNPEFNPRILYSEEEKQFLKNNYLNMTEKELGEKLNRSVNSVSNKKRLMKLVRWGRKVWTEKEEIFLKSNYLNMTNSELAEKLNRSIHSVEGKKCLMKLVRWSRKLWTKKEVVFLKQNYKKLTDRELAEKLDRSIESVHQKRFDLKLAKR